MHVAPGAEEAVAYCGGLRAVLAAAGVPASLELPRAAPAGRRSPERPSSGQAPRAAPAALAAQLPDAAAASAPGAGPGAGPGGCAAQAAAHAAQPDRGAAHDPEQAASSAGGSPEGAAALRGQPVDGGRSAALAARSSAPGPAQGGGRGAEPPVRIAWAHSGRVAAALRAPGHGLRDLLPPAGLVPPATLAALRYAALGSRVSSVIWRGRCSGHVAVPALGLTCSHAHMLPAHLAEPCARAPHYGVRKRQGPARRPRRLSPYPYVSCSCQAAALARGARGDALILFLMGPVRASHMLVGYSLQSRSRSMHHRSYRPHVPGLQAIPTASRGMLP